MEYWSVGVVSLRKLLCTHGAFLCSRFAVRSVASPPGDAPGKILRKRTGERLFEPTFGRGCSSVVEHLLAKEDVASSSLVTRSLSRLGGLPAGKSAAPARSIDPIYVILPDAKDRRPVSAKVDFHAN